ncbi:MULTISPECIES: hypothetical protein [Pseudoalteromonas]|uniref:Uncharacterized protein n=1 Tax=Pseudoalteromonas obscura TaxID=3048491 RepID=A0ABT7EKP0_9GAMM|nr:MULTISPECIES: hypothetical protein [Pseudoalteromonas]MBQ4837157.1 hypothetical protein [Pseudoalteromonas luteoviolacea]MDK2595617.1 hypothetical protein [Pseudoalteromonas sp. P94(2023)]
MTESITNPLQNMGLCAYSKEQYGKFFLAFRNTEQDVFVITELAKVNGGPGVKYRIQLPQENKIRFKSSMLSKTKSYYSAKVEFEGCYHNGDGELVINMAVLRLFNLPEESSRAILRHPKFEQAHLQIPVHIRLEDDRVYLLLDSAYDLEVLDADKAYNCFFRVKKTAWACF